MCLPRRHRTLVCSLAAAVGFSFFQAAQPGRGMAAAGPQTTVQPGGATIGLPPAARREAPAAGADQSRWRGTVQCTLTVNTATYQETQTHTWRMVSSEPLPFNRWPAVWSVQGAGNRHTQSNAGTITDNWTITVPETSAPITIRQRPGTAQIEIRSEHGLLVGQAAVNVTSSTGQRLTSSIQEWLFPVLGAAVSDTRITGNRTRTVGWPGNGWRVPSGVASEETCVWNLTKSVAAAALAAGADIEQLVQVVLREASLDAERDLRELLADMERQRNRGRTAGPAQIAIGGVAGSGTTTDQVRPGSVQLAQPAGQTVSLNPCSVMTTDLEAVYASTIASLAAAFDAQLRALDTQASALTAQLNEIAKQRASLSLQRPDLQSELRASTLDAQLKEIAKQRESLVKAAAVTQSELQKQKQKSLDEFAKLCETARDAATLDAFRTSVQSMLQQMVSQVRELLDNATRATQPKR